MQSLAYLAITLAAALLGALIGSLMRRRPRRDHLAPQPVSLVPVARSLSSEIDARGTDSASVSFGKPEEGAQRVPSAEAEIQAEISAASEGFANNSRETDHVDSAPLAENFQQETTTTETPSPVVAPPIAGIHDRSVPESISEGEEHLTSAGKRPTTDEASAEAVVASEERIGDKGNDAIVLEDTGSDNGPIDETEVDAVEAEPPDANPFPRQRRGEPSERHPEPVTEYPTVALPPPSADYRTWNRAIAEHLLLQTPAGHDVYLTITPRILARALVDLQGVSLNPEQAEEYFANSVSDFYRTRVLTHNARLRLLRRNGDDGLPECIGFLALTVLAAYRMRSDEEATGLAYYVRVAELLQCDLSGQYPPGFDPIVFESLWYFLRDWLAQRHGGRLVVPAPETASRRFVGLALAHVPLRSLDIEKLPDFFVWAGYQPSSEVTIERLAGDFARWVRARDIVTPTGVAAFSDARRAAVIAEIRAELDSWDGTCDESNSRHSAAVEILFDPVQHRPELFYVPRRPSRFPAHSMTEFMHSKLQTMDGTDAFLSLRRTGVSSLMGSPGKCRIRVSSSLCVEQGRP